MTLVDVQYQMRHLSKNELAAIFNNMVGNRLSGRPEQDIYEVSDYKNYSLGSRFQKDERVFRYGKVGDCGGPSTPWASGVGYTIEYGVPLSFAGTLKTAASIVSGSSGSLQAVITLGVDVTEDELENGYFGLHDSSGTTLWGCKIKGNTAATAGNNVTLTLESPLPVALEVGADTVTVMASPYSNMVRHSGALGDIYQSVVGMPMHYGAAPGEDLEGKFIWVQTWGPYAEPQIGVSHEGAASGERMLWFRNGALQLEAAYTTQQPAGYYIPEAQADLDHPVVWLTIAP